MPITPYHFPHACIQGGWHIVYRDAATAELHSVASGFTDRRSAQDEASRLNAYTQTASANHPDHHPA